jgi:hypothetical protein
LYADGDSKMKRFAIIITIPLRVSHFDNRAFEMFSKNEITNNFKATDEAKANFSQEIIEIY